MKPFKLVVVFILLANSLTAQKVIVNEFAAIDFKALKLPDSLAKTTENISKYITSNFKTEKEKTRAIFIWVASNISYDIENMFAIDFYEKKEDKITKPLRSGKGICENYAALFNDICAKSGIRSFVIEGYTKQNGFTDYIPHAWCAAMVDSVWYMFDPTWGSGYANGGRFFKKINNAYYRSSPAVFIRSHMPFDYMWQFLNYPVSNQEFYEGKTIQNKTKPYFNYKDSIRVYEDQNHTEQLVSSAYRIEKNGVKNAMIFDRLRQYKLEIENDKLNTSVNLYNAAVNDYNLSIRHFNSFVQYRNKQFIPEKTDAEIQKMIDDVTVMLREAKTKLTQIINPDAHTLSLISSLDKSIEEISAQVKEQQDWLTIYFSKGKSKRKSMFYEKKITWFGIPIK